MEAGSPVTALLNRAQQGDEQAAAEALELLYGELRQLAGGFMAGQKAGHTLQPTALVNEAWMRMAGKSGDWACRAQFFRFAAKAMRSVLVDHARRRGRKKRGGDATRQSLDNALLYFEERNVDLLALDEALEALEREDPRKRQVMELRLFAGLDMATVAELVGVSMATVERDWAFARAWVHRRVSTAQE